MFIWQLNYEREKKFEKFNSILRYMIKEKKRSRVIKKKEKEENDKKKRSWIKKRGGR